MADKLNLMSANDIIIFHQNEFTIKDNSSDTTFSFNKKLINDIITLELSKKFEQSVSAKIKRMCNFIDEDIDAIEYMDDDDERLIQYEIANSFTYYELTEYIRRNPQLTHNIYNDILQKNQYMPIMLNLNEKLAYNIKKCIINRITQLTGISKEDIDFFTYCGANDSGFIQYQIASAVAECEIFEYITSKKKSMSWDFDTKKIPSYYPFFNYVGKIYALTQYSKIREKIVKITNLSDEDIDCIEVDGENNIKFKQYYVAKKIVTYDFIMSLIEDDKSIFTLCQGNLNKQKDDSFNHHNANYLLVSDHQDVKIYLDLTSVTIHLCAPPIYEISGKYYSVKHDEAQKHFSHENYIRYDEETLTIWSKDNGKWKFLDVTGDFMVSLGNKSAANDLFNAAYGRNFYE